MPWRRNYIDAFEAIGAERSLQRPEGELPGVLLAVEPFFFKDVHGHTVSEQRQPGIVSARYDAKNAHEDAPIGSMGRGSAMKSAVAIALSFDRQRA
jgi:hypothetical protein